jgi:polyhydroxybutyrate depolymerase
VRKFVELDRCPADPKKEHLPDKVNDGTTIDATVYFSCAEGSEVRGYVVNGGGHTRPGGTPYLPAVFIGATTRNVDGSELIWDFLSRHSR